MADDIVYRSVLYHHQDPLALENNLPRFLTSFREDECSLQNGECLWLIDDGEEVSFGAFRNEDNRSGGLSLFSYNAVHRRPIAKVATDITTHGNYFLPILDDESLTKEAFRRSSLQWRRALKPPLSLVAVYACYSFHRSHLPETFDLIADENTQGRHCLCVRSDTFVPGLTMNYGGQEKPAVYCRTLLACGGWKPHCFRLKVGIEPRPFDASFDRDVWHTCCLIIECAGSCFEEAHCDALLALAQRLDECNYQLLIDDIGRDVCKNSMDALVALQGEIFSSEEYDVVDTTVVKIKAQVSLVESIGDIGDIVVYSGGDWEYSDDACSPPTVTITISMVLAIFERFAMVSTDFTKYVLMHGVPPADPEQWAMADAPIPYNFQRMAALLAQEGDKTGICMVGSFVTTLKHLSASSVVGLHTLLCADLLLANYFNACIICAAQWPVKNSAVIAVEAVKSDSVVAWPSVEQAACHTYVTLFSVWNKNLSDSQAGKLCSSLANGINFLQRNAWGIDGQRVKIMALGGLHKVDLSRVYSEEGTSQAWIDDTAAALTNVPLLRGITHLEHGTLSLSSVEQTTFIVCFSFYDSPALQQKIKATIFTSLRLMDVGVHYSADVCVPRNL